MKRDKIKDVEYFEEYLKYQNERIEKFTTSALQAEKSRGLSDSSTQRAYGFVIGFVRDKIYASYSKGNPVEEIRSVYLQFVDICKKSTSLSYNHLIVLVSLAILLKPDSNIVSTVADLVNRHNKEDILLEGFKNYLEGKGFSYSSKVFEFEETYKNLYSVIQQTDLDKQVELLANYIQNIWYNSNNDSAWYNSHNSKADTYVGYWCFEGVALAIALGLNIDRLKGLNFVPDDMI
jgi:hypothetical protein